jgi:hypothetical protein
MLTTLTLKKIFAKNDSYYDINDRDFYICLLLIAAIVIYFKTANLNYDIALSGWSVADYARHITGLPSFENDFPTGSANTYHESLPLQVMTWLYKVNPESINLYTHLYVAVTQALLVTALAYFGYTLFKNRLVALCIASLGMSSLLMGVNLANLGKGLETFPTYLHYPFYQACIIFALASVLRQQGLVTAILLLLALYCHVLIGTYAILALGVIVLVQSYYARRFTFGVYPALLLGFGFVLKLYMVYSSVGASVLPEGVWYAATRLFNFHYYVYSMGHLTVTGKWVSLPMLFSFLFYIPVYLSVRNENREMHDSLLFAVFTCSFVGILSVIISENTSSQIFITANPQRITEISSIICFSYVIFHLVRTAVQENIFFVTAALYALIFLFLSKPGITFVPLLLTMLPLKEKLGAKIFYTYLVLATLGIFTAWFFTPISDYLISGGQYTYKISIIFVLLGALLAIAVSRYFDKVYLLLPLLILTIGVKHYARYDSSGYDLARGNMEVQLWLKHNTPEDAVFLADPWRKRGWREFSERSSFGNIYEWAHTSLLYADDYDVYTEGVRRAKLFGFSFDDYLELDLSSEASTGELGRGIIAGVLENFLAYSGEELIQLLYDNNISYLILESKIANKFTISLEPAYQNKWYVVYYIPQQSS